MSRYHQARVALSLSLKSWQRICISFLVAIALVSSLCLTNSCSANAMPVEDSLEFLIRSIGEPTNLESLGLEKWGRINEVFFTKKELLDVSRNLRDRARYLGTGWPVAIALPELDDKADKPTKLITDFRESDEDWTTITIGQVLKMLARELEILNNSQEQTSYLDLLIKDETTNIYHPLLKVPLALYCSEVLKKFE